MLQSRFSDISVPHRDKCRRRVTDRTLGVHGAGLSQRLAWLARAVDSHVVGLACADAGRTVGGGLVAALGAHGARLSQRLHCSTTPLVSQLLKRRRIGHHLHPDCDLRFRLSFEQIDIIEKRRGDDKEKIVFVFVFVY